jgi:hypothetical protein
MAILGICKRFHCMPSQAVAEDAGILRLLRIEALGTSQEEGGEPEW